MAAGSADLHKGIYNLWIGSGLEAQFKSFWLDPTGEGYTAFNETEASPEQPWPYCIFTQYPGIPISRASGISGSGVNRHEERDVLIDFEILAKNLTTTDFSSKELAAYLMEEIMKVFGGHPTVAAQAICLDHGGVIKVQYITDEAERKDDEVYMWFVRYIVTIDAPVKS